MPQTACSISRKIQVRPSLRLGIVPLEYAEDVSEKRRKVDRFLLQREVFGLHLSQLVCEKKSGMNILSIRNVAAFLFRFQFNVKTEKKILSCVRVCVRGK